MGFLLEERLFLVRLESGDVAAAGAPLQQRDEVGHQGEFLFRAVTPTEFQRGEQFGEPFAVEDHAAQDVAFSNQFAMPVSVYQSLKCGDTRGRAIPGDGGLLTMACFLNETRRPDGNQPVRFCNVFQEFATKAANDLPRSKTLKRCLSFSLFTISYKSRLDRILSLSYA